LVVRENGKAIEVQIRTALQHVWAEMCEKFADVRDPAIKYGAGPESVRGTLDRVSSVIEAIEKAEAALVRAGAGSGAGAQKARAFARKLREQRNEYLSTLQSLIKEPIERDEVFE
jgi:ppGpp synthetase/RelA/SpoT-type nucleotidyltranferase